MVAGILTPFSKLETFTGFRWTICILKFFLTTVHLFVQTKGRCSMSAVDQIIVASLKQLNKENKIKALAYLEDMLNSLRIPASSQETKAASS